MSQVMFTLGFTVGTSIVLGTLKPYRQRQVGGWRPGSFKIGFPLQSALALGHEKILEYGVHQVCGPVSANARVLHY